FREDEVLLRGSFFGQFGANANGKNLYLFIDAETYELLNSGDLNTNGGVWEMAYWIMRVDTGKLRCVTKLFMANDTVLMIGSYIELSGLDFKNAYSLDCRIVGDTADLWGTMATDE